MLAWIAHSTDDGPARQEFRLTAADAISLGTRLINAASRQMQATIDGKDI